MLLCLLQNQLLLRSYLTNTVSETQREKKKKKLTYQIARHGEDKYTEVTNSNLAVARRTVNVFSPIFSPLREAQAMSVTVGSYIGTQVRTLN